MNENLSYEETHFDPSLGIHAKKDSISSKSTKKGDPAKRWNFTGIPDCPKCKGHGSYKSKTKNDKIKLCKKCVFEKGYCPKCNGSGFKGNDPKKPCRCCKKKINHPPTIGYLGTKTTGTIEFTGS